MASRLDNRGLHGIIGETKGKQMNRKNVAMLDKFLADIRDCIEVPNSMLPISYHSKRGVQTLASLERKLAKRERKIVDPREVRGSAERMAAIANYAAQVERGLDIEYDINHDKLYRHQVAFAQASKLDLED